MYAKFTQLLTEVLDDTDEYHHFPKQRSGQTVQMQIRMLLKEKSKQLCFNLSVAVPCGKTLLLGF